MDKQRWSLLGRIGSLSVCFCAVGSFSYSAQVSLAQVGVPTKKSSSATWISYTSNYQIITRLLGLCCFSFIGA